MEFYHFVNDESYALFCWLTGPGSAKREELIREAFVNVEKNDWFEMGMDVSVVARDELAELLEELVLSELNESDLLDHVFTNMEELEGDGLLCGHLIVCAAQRLYFGVVAEAVLRHAGKWAPDRERPEFL